MHATFSDELKTRFYFLFYRYEIFSFFLFYLWNDAFLQKSIFFILTGWPKENFQNDLETSLSSKSKTFFFVQMWIAYTNVPIRTYTLTLYTYYYLIRLLFLIFFYINFSWCHIFGFVQSPWVLNDRNKMAKCHFTYSAPFTHNFDIWFDW